MKLVKPPEPTEIWDACTLFLAGSIEQDKATRWQDRVIAYLKDLDITIWNPRRDNWDSSWEQDINNDAFREQVEWEWNALGSCDITVFYFDPDTKSPITLMEFGYITGLSCEDVLVYCPKGFWRKGNIDVICSLNKIPVFETEEEFLKALRAKIISEIE